MAVSESFRRFVLDQLGQLAPQVRGRSMFGGLGIYSGSKFFALIARDTLHLKVDDRSRPDFEALGAKPFRPFAHKPTTMNYYDVPLEVLKSVPRLRPYVEQALAAAQSQSPRRPSSK